MNVLLQKCCSCALSAALCCAACFASGCAQVTSVEVAAPAPAVVTATPAPTPSPVPTPTPTPTIRPILDDWYVERTEDMKKWMRLYGDLTEEEIEEKVARMAIDPDKPVVALTFDDGPMAGISDEIADILFENDCRATFFMRGGRMYYEPTVPILKKLLAYGNEIGNHTWNHIILTEAPKQQKLHNIMQVNEAVLEATGYTVRTLRPPGGKSNPAVGRVAKSLDMAVALWAQSGNVHERDPEKIAENVQKQIVNGKALQPGDIILLHDTKPWMVDAVRIIVPELLAQGYQLVTVWELINLSERGYIAGETYHRQDELATPTPEPPATPTPTSLATVTLS